MNADESEHLAIRHEESYRIPTRHDEIRNSSMNNSKWRNVLTNNLEFSLCGDDLRAKCEGFEQRETIDDWILDDGGGQVESGALNDLLCGMSGFHVW
jgi:hypothetical protein